MKIGKQERREGKQLFRACLVQGRVDEDRARRAVRLLLERKPRGYLEILKHFTKLLQLETARRTATVESASALSDELRQDVAANLQRLYGEGLLMQFRENQTLVGGLRIKVGSDVFDGSVQARLSALQESMSA